MAIEPDVAREMLEINRRSALGLSVAVGAIGAVASQARPAGLSTSTAAHETGECSTPLSAVAETQYGRIRGFVDDGVITFKGVPYGQDTGGDARWLPARPPKPWPGVRDTLIYGPNSPQNTHPWDNVDASFLLDWDDGYCSEDCLKLNIWTTSLTGKRPVMVYLHGGGFAFGSSYELPSQEGAQMARRHDVVAVSVNHRLNVLGFLDLSDVGGDAYAESANVGMTDLVAALRWVRDNIGQFGGDPSRVMIYGQSGGGSKVTTLMGMPSAAGLLHRAVAQSGGGGNFASQDQARGLTSQLMVELGLAPHDIAGLQKVAWSTLFAAGNAAIGKINPPAQNPASQWAAPGITQRIGWAPTMDGKVLPSRPFFDAAPEISKHIPFLIGSTSEEAFPNTFRLDYEPTESEWQDSLAKAYGEADASALVAAMKAAHPEKSIQKLAFGVQGLSQRNNIQRMIKLRLDQGAAPTFQYWFCWQTQQLEGRSGAYHTSELAFCFDNTQRCAQQTGNTPQAMALAKAMSAAWAAFAHQGDPGTPELAWPATTEARHETMVFDSRGHIVDDPDGAARRILLGDAALGG